MRTRLCAVLALVLVSGPVSAQSWREALIGTPGDRTEAVATIGALADIGATYAGLHIGERDGYTIGEANKFLSNSPTSAVIGLTVQFAVQKLVTITLRKRVPWLANAMAANAGGYQIGLGATWGRLLMHDYTSQTGYEIVNTALMQTFAPH